jgi:predicted DNA-binding protein with PD1-like motif
VLFFRAAGKERSMKVWEYSDRTAYLVRVDRGEEMMEVLRTVAKKRGVGAARVSGIGALENAELGYFDVERKEYLRKKLPGSWELLSLAGNISLRDGEVMPHIHVILGNVDLECRGGHLFSGVVSVTGEIFIEPLPGALHREMDREVNLPLLDH